MRFNCGPTAAEKRVARLHARFERFKAELEWHRWFAWYPVRLSDTQECVWLETIEIRGVSHIYQPDPADMWREWYRLIPEYETRGIK
jgi:hypothetical protein